MNSIAKIILCMYGFFRQEQASLSQAQNEPLGRWFFLKNENDADHLADLAREMEYAFLIKKSLEEAKRFV